MEVLAIGTLTVFTNVSNQQQYLFDASLNEQVSAAIVDWVKEDTANKFPDAEVVVISYETKTGCIITPVLFGAAIAKVAAASAGTAAATGVTLVGTGSAVYKLVTDYDKIKKNLKAIANDIKGLWLKITHRKAPQYKGMPSNGNGKETASNIDVFAGDFNELERLIKADKNTIIVSEKETITYHKVCLMRGDIKEEIQKEITEKEVKTISFNRTK